MKKFFLVALALLLFIPSFAKDVTVPASDGRISYVGRTLVDGGNVSFDWTGTYFRVKMKGSMLSMKVSDTKKNYYNVWVDATMSEKPNKVITVTGKDTSIVIWSQPKARKTSVHEITVQKRTEGEQGKTTIAEFTCDGEFIQADGPKERIIEYVGDSYTCGYGTEASNKERFSPQTENQNLTYACKVARYFGADQIVIAHSGMGILRNYNGNIPGDDMVKRYMQTFDQEKEPKWDAAASSLKPSITVIYLCTNDFSTGMQPSQGRFKQNYITLLKEIKANYGEDYPILMMVPKHDKMMYEYVWSVLNDCGLKNIHIMQLGPDVHNGDSDMGADGHPNGLGHTKVAYSLIPYISTITGWEMNENNVK
jgi:lysophospholipase L1-like esterase